jgi:hypothetical protein
MIKYTEEIWSDLTYEEKMAYKIYEAFQVKTKKIGIRNIWLPSASSKSYYNYDRDGKYPGDKIRESKNWKYFVEVYEMFENAPDFDENIFMESVFRNVYKGQRIYPAQLRTKKIIQQYKDYRLKLKMTNKIDNDKILMQHFANSYKYIKNKMKKDELSVEDIYNFFNNVKDKDIISDGMKAAMLEMLSPYYLAVSKSFEIAYFNSDKDIQDEIISLKELDRYRSIIKLKTRIYSFAKKIFGDDII